MTPTQVCTRSMPEDVAMAEGVGREEATVDMVEGAELIMEAVEEDPPLYQEQTRCQWFHQLLHRRHHHHLACRH